MPTSSSVNQAELNKEIQGTTKTMVDFRRELQGFTNSFYQMEIKQDTSALTKLADVLDLIAATLPAATSKAKNPWVVGAGEVAGLAATYGAQTFRNSAETLRYLPSGDQAGLAQASLEAAALANMTNSSLASVERVNSARELLQKQNEALELHIENIRMSLLEFEGTDYEPMIRAVIEGYSDRLKANEYSLMRYPEAQGVSSTSGGGSTAGTVAINQQTSALNTQLVAVEALAFAQNAAAAAAHTAGQVALNHIAKISSAVRERIKGELQTAAAMGVVLASYEEAGSADADLKTAMEESLARMSEGLQGLGEALYASLVVGASSFFSG